MGRTSQFSADDILDAALTVGSVQGFAEITVTAVAKQLQAASGSLYYRFSNRDELMTSLWLRTQQHYQHGLLKCLRGTNPISAVKKSALFTVKWARNNLTEARLLLLYRIEDLTERSLTQQVEDELESRIQKLNLSVSQLAARLGEELERAPDLRRLHFVVMSIPLGAVRAPLDQGHRPAKWLEGLVREATVSMLDLERTN